MADDWIKMRENLHEDPAILRMAFKLGTRPEHVVGYCHRFWCWVSRNVSPVSGDKCPAECVTGVPIESVEAVLNMPGFLGLMQDAGWLEYETGGEFEYLIRIPKFERHLSESAKKRAEDARKKQKQRKNAANQQKEMSPESRDKCPENVPKKAGPEKRREREEKRREEGEVSIRASARERQEYSPEFEQFWAEYPRRIGKGKAYSKWQAATKSTPPEVILEAARAFALADCVVLAEPQFVPHPATWLHGRRWEDDRSEWKHAGGNGSNGKPAYQAPRVDMEGLFAKLDAKREVEKGRKADNE